LALFGRGRITPSILAAARMHLPAIQLAASMLVLPQWVWQLDGVNNTLGGNFGNK
jgi:hypothetical protein